MIDLRSDTATNPIRQTAVITTSVFLILIFAGAGQGQRRTRLQAPKALLELLDKDERDCVSQEGLDKSVKVQPIRLARDRTRQILIRGAGLCLCGAQNCGFWVYRKTGSNYKLLLQGTGSTKVSAGRYAAYGYRDVQSESHAGAMETIVRTYRYDGSQYQPQRCVSRAYYDDNGKYTKRPFYRPCEPANDQNKSYVSLPPGLLDLELPTIDDRVLKLSDYSGRIVIINLFASWCPPCRENIADLVELSKTTNQVVIIGVTTAVQDPQIEAVRRFTSTLKVGFPIVRENLNFSKSLSQAVNANEVLPQIFVIDKKNRIRKYFMGYNRANTSPLLRNLVRELEAEGAKGPA